MTDISIQKINNNHKQIPKSLRQNMKISLYAMPSILASRTKIQLHYEDILRILKNYHDIDEDVLKGKGREREVVVVRQLIFYFLRKYSKSNLKKIGKYLYRDHATVLHSCRVVKNLIETDKVFEQKVLIIDHEVRQMLEGIPKNQ